MTCAGLHHRFPAAFSCQQDYANLNALFVSHFKAKIDEERLRTWPVNTRSLVVLSLNHSIKFLYWVLFIPFPVFPPTWYFSYLACPLLEFWSRHSFFLSKTIKLLYHVVSVSCFMHHPVLLIHTYFWTGILNRKLHKDPVTCNAWSFSLGWAGGICHRSTMGRNKLNWQPPQNVYFTVGRRAWHTLTEISGRRDQCRGWLVSSHSSAEQGLLQKSPSPGCHLWPLRTHRDRLYAMASPGPGSAQLPPHGSYAPWASWLASY